MYIAKENIPDDYWLEIKLGNDNIHMMRLETHVVIGMFDFNTDLEIRKQLYVAGKRWALVEKFKEDVVMKDGLAFPNIFVLCGSITETLTFEQLERIRNNETPTLVSTGFVFEGAAL